MEDKDAELGLGVIATQLLASSLDILLKLLDSVLERCAGIVNLVDNQDSLADEVLHLAEGGQVQPLSAGNLGAGDLNLRVSTEGLVEREADGLDGDVGRVGLLEERSQDTGRDVAAATDGDHELGLEVGQKLDGSLLAHLMDL